MKIGTSALILSLIVSSIMAFVPNAFATAQISASNIVSPLLTPGSIITMDVYVSQFADLYAFDFKVTFDPTILKCVSLTALRGSPALFTVTTARSINNVAGYVRLAANRGTLGGFSDNYPIIIALAGFEVMGTGSSPLHFDNAVLKTKTGGVIPVEANDGFFDNRPNGIMSVPSVIDTSALTTFDCPVYLSDILQYDVAGWQFKLTFDPNMLAVASYEVLGGFSEVSPDVSVGAIFLGGLGGPIAPGTVGPVQIATIHFNVLRLGVTRLSLSLVRGVSSLGYALYFTPVDGSFANTQDLAVSIETIFLPASTYYISIDGPIADLTAQVRSAGAGVTMTYAKFKVTDTTGATVAEVTTTPISILPGDKMRLSTQLDMSKLATGAHYIVEGTVFYLDANAAWAQGQKGSPQGYRNSMIKEFDLYA